MKLVFVIIGFFFISSCCSQKFVDISKKIDSQCSVRKNTWNGETFHQIRQKLFDMGKLGFININSAIDTIYLLQTYEVETGNYIGMIWNRNGQVSFVYNKGVFDFSTSKLFTKYTQQLIQQWDLKKIRDEEKLNALTLPEKIVNGFRVIVNKSASEVNCITFKEFFDLKRDS